MSCELILMSDNCRADAKLWHFLLIGGFSMRCSAARLFTNENRKAPEAIFKRIRGEKLFKLFAGVVQVRHSSAAFLGNMVWRPYAY